MIRQIRRGVFETNSSSTHSITIVSQEDYDKWTKGELLLCDSDEFITREEAIKELKDSKYCKDLDFEDEDAVNEMLRESEMLTSDQFWDDEYLEGYDSSFTTKSGDKVVAFGKYGTDN